MATVPAKAAINEPDAKLRQCYLNPLHQWRSVTMLIRAQQPTPKSGKRGEMWRLSLNETENRRRPTGWKAKSFTMHLC